MTLLESVPLLVTLGILDVVEQESLLLSIEGSADSTTWSTVAAFPEKFYPGVSAIYFDPAIAGTKYLRAQWKVNRWGRGEKTPKFRLYLFVEPV